MPEKIKRFTFAGADFELSVIDGELVIDVATQNIDPALLFAHPDAIPRVFVRLNEGAIRTNDVGDWENAQ
jgi:hypothetical protein